LTILESFKESFKSFQLVNPTATVAWKYIHPCFQLHIYICTWMHVKQH